MIIYHGLREFLRKIYQPYELFCLKKEFEFRARTFGSDHKQPNEKKFQLKPMKEFLPISTLVCGSDLCVLRTNASAYVYTGTKLQGEEENFAVSSATTGALKSQTKFRYADSMLCYMLATIRELQAHSFNDPDSTQILIEVSL